MSRAYPGDEVFFHHAGEPKVGKVLCSGRHGVTVEHGKDRHKLKWEHIAGFKSRAPQQYKVVDHGHDGMIVENQDGRRRYVHIPPEAKAEQLELAPQQKKNQDPSIA